MPPNRRLALEKYQRVATTYDHGAHRFQNARRRAVALLRLHPGDIVLDVGCGTGLSFPLIEEAVGTAGPIIGIDQSPDMLAKARERIDRAGWQNVTLIRSPVDEADIAVQADAALFCFTHDIMQTPQALENVFQHVRRGGRAAVAGTKWAPWWASPLNLLVWQIARHAMTTLEGLSHPWRQFERFVSDLRVEHLLLGTQYVAWGTVPGGQ